MTNTTTPTFDLEVSPQDGCQIFRLKGRLMDQPHADQLMQALDDAVNNGNTNVVLDLGALQYMNSTGLNILINVLTRTRNAGGDAVIAALSNSVRQLFVVTKLDSVFQIAPDVKEAVGRFKQA